jgi:hypothetical protein
MSEDIFYFRREEGFEAFPAENYVDYMTNVMPIPERHFFFIPQREKTIVCELRSNIAGERVLKWSIVKNLSAPSDVISLKIDGDKIDEILTLIDGFDSPQECPFCENTLYQFFRKN